MKHDIKGMEDVKTLVNTFYERVQHDDVLGPIFNNVVKDWSAHLPKMYNFWSTALFYEPGYSGNAVAKHIEVDHRFPLGQKEYARWPELWFATVDSLFEGPNAEAAKKRATLMLQLIHLKVDASHDPGFIQ